MIFLNNAFSLNMVQAGGHIQVEIIPAAAAATICGYGRQIKNCIGHADTDVIIRGILAQYGADIPPGERVSVTLSPGDVLIVAQYSGPRLPEGTTELPPGAKITFFRVTFEPERTCQCGSGYSSHWCDAASPYCG